MSKGFVCPFLSAGILSSPHTMMMFRPGEKISPRAYSRCLGEACAIFNCMHQACSLLIISCEVEIEEEQDELRLIEIIRDAVEREFRLEAKREAEERARRRMHRHKSKPDC